MVVMNAPQAPASSADDPLSVITDLPSLAKHLISERLSLFEELRSGMGGLAFARAHSDLVDSVVRRMLTLACERSGSHHCEAVPIAVVATGGYGRRELSPHSDIDITFIPYRDGDPAVDRIIKEMFTSMMKVFIDEAGMEVGYAYRLIQDCANLDHQTTCGLLDARLISGSDRLFIQFEHDFWLYLNPADFVFAKIEERHTQQAKTGGTPRIVEPNLKEGAGGLRDIQTAVWATQALQSRNAARVRGERAWEILARDAEVSPAEIHRLKEAKEFLFRVRNALHVITGAERDQLVVTRQEEAAELLGYERDDFPHSAPPVERFMRDYYGHATAVHRITEAVLDRANNSRMFLSIGLDCSRREIVPANTALLHEDPIWMLWACELAQKHGLRFSNELERAVIQLTESCPPLHRPAEAGDIFRRILSSPKGAYPILQKMADLGILDWLLPEVGSVLNLIPYDPSHDYTVGQHTLYVVRNLDLLSGPDGGDEMRDFRQAMAELAHPEELYLAALLHDAGKDDGLRPHAEVGEEIALGACRRLGWGERAAANVAFVVRHHLLMAETSRLRDLNLDETIRDFTAIVDDVDRLHMLFLLTYADTSAVGAGVWTQVKGKFLRDLLHRAERSLSGDEAGEYDDAGLSRTRRRLMKELSVENLPADEVNSHVEGMPATYLLNTSREEIALHIGFVRKARQREPVIDFHDERDSTFTEVTVCTLDDPEPGLLAKIAGVFHAIDLEVHSAQVFTRIAPRPENDHASTETGAPERIAIDNFYVDFRGRQLTPGKRKELATTLAAVLKGQTSVADVLAKRRRSVDAGGPVSSLSVRNDVSDSWTFVEVSAPNDRAMLYRASAALSALHFNIRSAKVSHFSGQNIAGFYVSGANRQDDAAIKRQLERVMPVVKNSV
jgi:[protein-PII] uridylyltransferase